MNNSMHYIELEADALVCRQLKDSHGLCIIPDEQSDAAMAWLKEHGKKLSHITGNKRTNILKFHFEPEFTLEELEALE